MANQTDEHALHRLGTDPQDILPKTTRHAIYTSRFWNARLFGVNLADLVHEAVSLTHIAAQSSESGPAPFLCMLLKLLQLAPEEPEIAEYLTQPHFKYPRVLAAFYVRLSLPPVRVYRCLEPLLSDYRRLVIAPDSAVHHSQAEEPGAAFALTHVDAFVDALLTEPRILGITLPRLPPRPLLVHTSQLSPRRSALVL